VKGRLQGAGAVLKGLKLYFEWMHQRSVMAIQTQSADLLKAIVLFLIAMTLGQLLETSGWRENHSSDRYRPFYEHNGNQIDSLKYTANVVHRSFPPHTYRCCSHTVSFPVSNYSLYQPYYRQYQFIPQRYNRFPRPNLP
jgi:hypothetical protein